MIYSFRWGKPKCFSSQITRISTDIDPARTPIHFYTKDTKDAKVAKIDPM
jgi:hypothetical protein